MIRILKMSKFIDILVIILYWWVKFRYLTAKQLQLSNIFLAFQNLVEASKLNDTILILYFINICNILILSVLNFNFLSFLKI